MNVFVNQIEGKYDQGAVTRSSRGSEEAVKKDKTSGMQSVFIWSQSENAVGMQAYRTSGKQNTLLDQAIAFDEKNNKNYMVVMSQTMSAEDYKKLQEDGVNPADCTPHEMVTVMDQIKVTLAKAGVEIAGFTDDLDLATIKETGVSEGYANAIANACIQKNIPVTEDNIKAIASQMDQMQELQGLSDSARQYLIENDLPPTFENLYKATYATGKGEAVAQGYFQTDSHGYMAKKGDADEVAALDDQIKKIVEQAGLGDRPQSFEDAQWLLKRGLMLTDENLHYMAGLDTAFSDFDLDSVALAAADAIAAMNASKAFTVSVDIPSGVDATGGEVMGKAVRADLTTTYSFLKRGHVLYPGREYCGEVLCRNIGITENSFSGHTPECFCLEEGDIQRLLPVRKRDSHKGTYGRVLVAAGSPGMAGASLFAARAAFLAGAGLVDLLTAEENRVIVQESLPEAILHTYSGKCPDSLVKDCCDRADCIVIGPGLSTEKNAISLFQAVFETASVPMVIDADGLNILSMNMSLLQRPHTSLVLTPHPGELSRLLSEPYDLIRPRIFSACGDFSRANQVTLVAKGASTLIFEPFRETCINTTGDDSLSTAGSGDILAGLTGGLIAAGMKTPDAARTAVYLHGKAGEAAGQKRGRRSCMAGDILSALPETFQKYE